MVDWISPTDTTSPRCTVRQMAPALSASSRTARSSASGGTGTPSQTSGGDRSRTIERAPPA